MTEPSPILVSVVTCPHCGRKSQAQMPIDACQHFWECPLCGTLLKPKLGDCCVFCSYGSVRCPPKQAEQRERMTGDEFQERS